VNVNAKRAIARNKQAGHHYFDRETMLAFGSTVHKAYEATDGTLYVVMSNRWGEPPYLGEHDSGSFLYHVVVKVTLDGQATREAGHLVMDGIVPDRSSAWTYTQADNYAKARASQ
jgi:predicted heme/steroid binding protein